jgi:hypothetical protein
MTSRPAVTATAGSKRVTATAPAAKEPNPAIDIVTAMNDPAPFQPWFRGETWDGWRAVFKAAYALPMTVAEIEFFRSIADRDPPQRQVKELWCVVGKIASPLPLPGSMVIGISSPYRKKGLLYNKFKQHFGKDGDILVIRAATRHLNATIDQTIIDEAPEEDL